MRRRVFKTSGGWTEGANPSPVDSVPPKPRSSDRSDRTKVKAGAHVVGLDLSLRSTGLCALPVDWDFDLRNVKMGRTGYELRKDSTPKERIERLAQIAHDVSVFCVNAKAIRIGQEEYAYGAGGSRALELAESGGAVKVDLLETLGLASYPVQASNARKVLLQHVPRLGKGKTKPWVIANVRRLGPIAETWTEDQCDAFVVANTVLMHAGYTAMSFPGT